MAQYATQGESTAFAISGQPRSPREADGPAVAMDLDNRVLDRVRTLFLISIYRFDSVLVAYYLKNGDLDFVTVPIPGWRDIRGRGPQAFLPTGDPRVFRGRVTVTALPIAGR